MNILIFSKVKSKYNVSTFTLIYYCNFIPTNKKSPAKEASYIFTNFFVTMFFFLSVTVTK